MTTKQRKMVKNRFSEFEKQINLGLKTFFAGFDCGSQCTLIVLQEQMAKNLKKKRPRK